MRRLAVVVLAVVVVAVTVAVAKPKKKTIAQRVADLEAAVNALGSRSVVGPPGKNGPPGAPGLAGKDGAPGVGGSGGSAGLLVLDATGLEVGVLAIEERADNTSAIRRIGPHLVGFRVDVDGFTSGGAFFEYEAHGCQGPQFVPTHSSLVRNGTVGGSTYEYAGDPVQKRSIGSIESETDAADCTPDIGCTVLQNGHCCCNVGDDVGDSTSGAFIDHVGPVVTGSTASFGLNPPFHVIGR